MRYGLIGEHLGHSHSKMIHALLGAYPYELYELPEEEIGAFIAQKDIGGLNVTIPYKKTVIPFCDRLTREARRIGSVNTLVRCADGSLLGHNTDYAGFVHMARGAGVDFAGRKALVLGSGGASLTAVAAARDLGARSVTVISRSGEDNYTNLRSRHADAQIIVNCTPVGMFPRGDGCPVDISIFGALEGVLDMVYNPLRTNLVLDARARGVKASGGLDMLVAQACEACACFTGVPVPPERARRALDQVRAQVENIVLIGMPGSGKSAVGRLLSQKTGRELIDVDQLIVREAGKTVPQIFAQEGERAFREREARAVEQASAMTGKIIATGGGAVLRERNVRALKRGGRLYLLSRLLEKLDMEDRPLSSGIDALRAMQAVRDPIYRASADKTIDNNGALESAAGAILEDFYAYTGT